jgi:sterol desaturase/sphingolipid hydroxylase (fatty acid hydroxylase superfamily)
LNSVFSAFAEIRFPRLWMPAALYIPLGLLLSGLSFYFHPRSVKEIPALFVIGLFSWTLIEYFLHRFIFHGIKTEPWKSLTAVFHLSHHEAVAAHGPDLVITRPAGSLPFAILFYFLFALLSLSFSAAALIETGVFAGYLFYECVHYSVHHFQPKSRLGQLLRNYHLQHHLVCPDRRFGVTSPLWDRVFGTYEAAK